MSCDILWYGWVYRGHQQCRMHHVSGRDLPNRFRPAFASNAHWSGNKMLANTRMRGAGIQSVSIMMIYWCVPARNKWHETRFHHSIHTSMHTKYIHVTWNICTHSWSFVTGNAACSLCQAGTYLTGLGLHAPWCWVTDLHARIIWGCHRNPLIWQSNLLVATFECQNGSCYHQISWQGRLQWFTHPM